MAEKDPSSTIAELLKRISKQKQGLDLSDPSANKVLLDAALSRSISSFDAEELTAHAMSQVQSLAGAMKLVGTINEQLIGFARQISALRSKMIINLAISPTAAADFTAHAGNTLRDQGQLDDACMRTARYILEKKAKKEGEEGRLAARPEAVHELCRTIQEHVPKVWRDIDFPTSDEPDNIDLTDEATWSAAWHEANRVLRNEGAIFGPDAQLIAYIEALDGGDNADMITWADWLRARALERAEEARQPFPAELPLVVDIPAPDVPVRPGLLWTGWFDINKQAPTAMRWLIPLGGALWVSVARHLRSARTNQPALSLPIARRAHAFMQPRLSLKDADGEHLLLDEGGNPISLLRPALVRTPVAVLGGSTAQLHAGIRVLGSVASHRLFRWEVREGHRRWQNYDPDPRRIEYIGSWRDFAAHIGVSKKQQDHVKAVLEIQALAVWSTQTGGVTGNLLSYQYTRGGGRHNKSKLVIILGDDLLPPESFSLPRHTRSQREARLLVPIVDEPALIGRGQDHGPQLSLQHDVVIYIREQAMQLATHGGVRITKTQWESMARASQVPARMLPKVLKAWLAGTDMYPPFLCPAGTDRYALAEDPKWEGPRNFLLHAGWLSLTASKRAKKARLTASKSVKK